MAITHSPALRNGQRTRRLQQAAHVAINGDAPGPHHGGSGASRTAGDAGQTIPGGNRMMQQRLRAIGRLGLVDRTIIVAVTAASLLGSVCARAGELHGEISLASQLIDRGLAITPVTPTLQAAASWSTRSGWSLGASAGVELRSPDHAVASAARLARIWSLSENWRLQAGVVYYHYDGLLRANAYEPGVYFMYRDILTFGVSGIHAAGAAGPWFRQAADLNFHWPLAGGVYLSGGVGVAPYAASYRRADEESYPGRESYHESHHYSGYYRYGQAGLLWSHGSWRVELDRVMVDPNTRQRLRGRIAASWLATVSWSF